MDLKLLGLALLLSASASAQDSNLCVQYPGWVKAQCKENLYFPHCRYGQFGGCVLKKGTLLGTLPQLKMEFMLSFEFRATAWARFGGWQSVIRLTQGGTCCEVGDRVPLFLVKDSGQLHPCFAVGDDGNYCATTKKEYSLNTWHKVEISQSLENGKYMYRVVVDGEDIITPVENTNPTTFSNVKVFAADNVFNPLEGSIRNVVIDSDTGCLKEGRCATDDGCLKEDNIDYYGNPIEHKKTNSMEECANWCGKEADCKFWTLRKSDNYCWIKTSDSGRREDTKFMSGTKNCATGDGCLKEDNIDYVGNPIEDKKTNSMEECANWCGKEDNCKFWTFRKSDNYCWIKTSDSGRRANTKVMSGTKNCHENWFYIMSELNSQAITIRGGKKHKKNDVVMWRKEGTGNQLWKWVGNSLVSKLNGLALTIKNADKEKKATVWMMPRNGGREQQWRMEDGRLVSELNRLMLDVKMGDKKRGNTVWMWYKNQSKAQKWKLPLAENVKIANYCTGEAGCCTEEYKCDAGEGDCDNENQCKGDLLCGKNNCPKKKEYHWDGADCCTKGSKKCEKGNPICQECTEESPCARASGTATRMKNVNGPLFVGREIAPGIPPGILPRMIAAQTKVKK